MNEYPIKIVSAGEIMQQYDDKLNKCGRCKKSWFSTYILPNFCNKCGDLSSNELNRIKEKIKNESKL